MLLSIHDPVQRLRALRVRPMGQVQERIGGKTAGGPRRLAAAVDVQQYGTAAADILRLVGAERSYERGEYRWEQVAELESSSASITSSTRPCARRGPSRRPIRS